MQKKISNCPMELKGPLKRPRNASTQPACAPQFRGAALSTGAARRQFVDGICGAKRRLIAVAAKGQ